MKLTRKGWIFIGLSIIVWSLIAIFDKPAKSAEPAHVINAENFKQFLDVPGHATGFDPKLKPKLFKGTLPKWAATITDIPRSQWPQLVAEGKGTFLSDLIKALKIPVKNQDSLNYCWVYASTETVEVLRGLQGQPYVDLSPESVGGPLLNWRNQGGNGLDAMQQLMSTGACATSFMDAANSLRPNRWKTGWEDNRAQHKITASFASVDTFDDVFTAVLMRCPVSIGLDWWGHQVLVTDPYIFNDGSYGVLFRNSWGNNWPSAGAGGWSTLTEAKSQPDGSFATIAAGVYDVKPGMRKLTPIERVRQNQSLIRARIHKQLESGGCQN